jgi:hypothetical protein
MSARGFLKLAVRRSIQSLGGIAGGERATGLGHAQVGRWHSRNDHDLPGLEHALALDEAALACGGRALILEALAAELGHVAIQLPEACGEGREVALQLAAATAEFGEIAQAVLAGLADGRLDGAERGRVAGEIDDAMRALGTLRALVIEEEPRVAPVRVAK